jgi:hypothetical protein
MCEQKDIQSYELVCTHKKRSEISRENLLFLDSSHDLDDECFTDVESHIGFGCVVTVCNIQKVCCCLRIEVVTTNSVV